MAYIEKIKKFVIVRACVGCVLPSYAKLIGSGDFSIFKNARKQSESYYDYEIEEFDLDDFLTSNDYVLKKNQLLDLDSTIDESGDETIKNTYTKKEYKV